MKLNILVALTILASAPAMAGDLLATDLGFTENLDVIQAILDAPGPKAIVEADTPLGAKAGYFQVMVTDDQKSLVSVVMQQNGSNTPTVLTAAQIMASTAAAPLVLLDAAPLGKLVTIYRDPALTPTAGGKINVLTKKDGKFNAAGSIEIVPNGGGWTLTGNGRPFAKIAMKVTMSGVESFEFK